MLLKRIPAGVYAANCYVITCEDTKKTAIIDPGGDANDIVNYIERNDLDLDCIILTHAHGDHIGGVPEIKDKKGVPVFIHNQDADMLKNKNRNMTSLMSGPDVEVVADKLLQDGDTIKLGNLELNIIHTPGHTRGGICIQIEDILITGDTLFTGSIGRTDFEGGSYEEIIDSIKKKLLVFDNQMKVYPGHGPESTIGVEKRTNPYIR